MRLSRSTAIVRLRDVGAAHAVVACQHLAAADVVAGTMRGDGQLGDGGGIAQAEIEPLRADRRDDVRGFARPARCAARRSGRRWSRASGNSAAPGLDRRSCRGSNARAVRSRAASAASSSAANVSASAGSSTHTRLERLPGSGTSVKGPLAV